MILYRPTGLKELQLVAAADMRAWPPRLPDQPIFYPVLTFDYAEKIARDWNSALAAPDNLGFVTEFEITPEMAAKYPVEIAEGKAHTELWVPAEELEAFNAGIIGKIKVVAAYQDRQSVLVESVWPANG
ncbi:MAG TPA: ADP-ribosylation/crystallin J1 [Rhodobacteraceae bacterium]|nr:ADP-ribosylation/crystallin J1 [Paracoccaceae bacterium]